MLLGSKSILKSAIISSLNLRGSSSSVVFVMMPVLRSFL